MAGYFNGTAEIQPDGLQTLYLMNPSLVESSSPPSANMVLFNPSMSSLNHSHQHLVGIPLQRPPSSIPLWTPAPSHQPLSLGLSRHQGPHAAAAGPELSPDSSRASSTQGVFMGSKYLKAAQQLLDEAVSVGGGIGRGELAKEADSMRGSRWSGGEKADASSKRGEDLTNAERQELHMKKGKLANMLDEVEQRYRQYRHQMQIIVSSFEVIAGIGSARTYTALALQTISKQFRNLRDAISGEIRAASRSLGEDDPLTVGANSVGSRLRFVDHHLRQQRALQQIGMVHHNTWRPQRGLPERAVSVLRAWLFEHFLHPYPKDSDKHMLAKQTGLTRSQVSNWFINARVRLWKPMVEEMYLEESKDQEPNNANGNASEPHGDEESKFSAQHEMMIPTRTTQTDILESNEPRAHPIGTPSSVLGIVEDHDVITQHCVKRSRVDLDEMRNHELLMKFMEAKNSTNYGYDNLMQGGTNIGIAGYSIGEIDRFNDDHGQFPPRFSGNGVSLTLGLHSEESPSLSGVQPSYLSSENIPLGRRVEMNNPPSDDYFSLNNNNTSAPHPPIAYESITIQNRKRFNAQILQDFVA